MNHLNLSSKGPLPMKHLSHQSPTSKMHLSAPSLCFLLALLATLHRSASSRRMCGQVLTRELKRVCTKQGMKGPCLHGAANFAPVQKRRGGCDSLVDSLVPYPPLVPFPPLPPFAPFEKWGGALSTTVPLFFAQFVAGNKKSVVLERHSPFWPSKTTTEKSLLRNWHPISRRNGGNNWQAEAEEREGNGGEGGGGEGGQRHNLLRAKRAKGIVDKCCSAEGCDDAFLDSFCCDETEEKAFRDNHKL